MSKTQGLFGLVATILMVGGCNSTPPRTDPRNEGTLNLCRAIATTDERYRNEVIQVLIKRGASAEKCQRLIETDRAVATTVIVGGAVAAAGVAEANSGGGGGYYSPTGAYGVAWDQFYDQNRMLTWRCRDKATGQFVYDSACSSKPMVDTTWPGWSA